MHILLKLAAKKNQQQNQYLFQRKMMRQAALQGLRSTKKQPKPKPFWLLNITVTSQSRSNPVPYTKSWSLSRQPRTFPFRGLSPLEPFFTVTRSKPELVGPAEPTPRKVETLSAIDDQVMLRCLVPFVHFYRYDPSMEGKDPARVVREALAKALVPYFPMAGRIVEGPDGKLHVDCTGEGVVFVEADVDVELAQLGDPPRPPFPWLDRLFYDDTVCDGIIDCPLFFIQVTRLKCGGFVLAFRYNHIISDARGLVQFLTAVGQIARGASAPSIAPIWSRGLLSVTRVPRPEIISNIESDEREGPDAAIVPFHNIDMIQQSIFLGPSKLSSIRELAPCATMFEILTACLWRCRTIALRLDPEDVMRLIFPVTAREGSDRVLPVGYYGNAAASAVNETRAKELCEGPVGYALGLVKKAKENAAKEYMSWRTDGPVVRVPPFHSLDKLFIVTDARQVGFGDVDFGWGKAVFAGTAKVESDPVAVYLPFRNHDGEDGILVTFCLESTATRRFETELNNLLSHGST